MTAIGWKRADRARGRSNAAGTSFLDERSGNRDAKLRCIANEATFRDNNLIARGLEPVFDAPEEFARFLGQDRI